MAMLSGKSYGRRDHHKHRSAPRRATAALLGVQTNIPPRLQWERSVQRFGNRERLQLPPIRAQKGRGFAEGCALTRAAPRRRRWQHAGATELVPLPKDFAAVLPAGSSRPRYYVPKSEGSAGARSGFARRPSGRGCARPRVGRLQSPEGGTCCRPAPVCSAVGNVCSPRSLGHVSTSGTWRLQYMRSPARTFLAPALPRR